jgi:hypothetical protein
MHIHIHAISINLHCIREFRELVFGQAKALLQRTPLGSLRYLWLDDGKCWAWQALLP